MRQSVFFLFIAAGALCTLCSGSHGAERKRTANPTPRAAKTKPSSQKTASFGESAEARALRPFLGESFQATPTEHFVLFHEPGAGYLAEACGILEHAYECFYAVFSQAGFELSPPKDRLVWICFPQKNGFNKYALQAEGMDLSWLDGYYSTLTNRVAVVQTDQETRWREVVPPSGGDVRMAVAKDRSSREGVLPMSAAGSQFDVTRLTHEVAHQLSFNSGIQKRGVMYPLWVSEGLATNFEFDGSANTGLEQGNTARCKGLLEAYAAGELIPLRHFVVQTTVPPDFHVGRRYYAQAWGFFQFILTERPENLRTYLRRLAELRLDRRDTDAVLAEFTAAFGAPEILEESWNMFLARHARQALANRRAASLRSDAADVAQVP